MRMMTVALLASVMASANAAAQTLQIESVVSDPIIFSAHLSPDGEHVVAIRSSQEMDEILRVDWRSGQAAVFQRLRRGDRQNQLDWIDWKSDERLIFAVTTTRTLSGSTEFGTRTRRTDDQDIRVTRIGSVNIDGSGVTWMFEGERRQLAGGWSSTRLVDPLPNDPDHVLLSAYGRDGLMLWRANILSGEAQPVDDAGWIRGGWSTDGAGNAVVRTEFLSANRGYRISRRGPDGGRWVEHVVVRSGERINSPDFDVVAPGPGAGEVWVLARPPGNDTAGLYLFNTATGDYGEARYESAAADFEGHVWLSRNNDTLLAACVQVQRRECRFFDDDVRRHIGAVDAYFGGAANVTLIDMSEDGSVWLLYVQGPTTAPGYHVYDRAARRVVAIAGTQPNMADSQLSPMEVVSYTGRDGASLWGYLTRPAAAPATSAPLVVLPHGGPESRDLYGYEPTVQFLASRGYLVFQPQFRGSGGFGTAFADAGRGQWGQRMQDDVTDGVRHLIETGAVDPARVCVVGYSYGGYAALAGATLTPDLYRCAVSINGVADLPEMLNWERTESGRYSFGFDYWRRSIGDPAQARTAIEAVSPSRNATAVRIPILLVASAGDTVVPVNQSRLMRDALTRAGGQVRYVEIAEGDHSWSSWVLEDRVRLLTELETFLAQHLGH